MMSLNSSQFTHYLTQTLMSRDVMIGLLRKGKNGSQILDILEAISNNEEPVIIKAEPTLEPLEF